MTGSSGCTTVKASVDEDCVSPLPMVAVIRSAPSANAQTRRALTDPVRRHVALGDIALDRSRLRLGAGLKGISIDQPAAK